MTRDMWHMTRETWHVGGDEHSLKNFSSLVLTVCDFRYYEDMEEKADSLKLINDMAVYRAAPATPGLLNIEMDRCSMIIIILVCKQISITNYSTTIAS